jgi:aspartyl-tRNA(Asn)/glutamyl-tRNA(Gln) amidotransferase subunit A
MSHPADLQTVEAAALLARGELSAAELTDACLERIEARDGEHSHDGSPDAINAWVRVYADDARAAAAEADRTLAAARDGGAAAPALTGVPVGLKDLYSVAGKPITASSRVGGRVAEVDSEVWTRLRGAGMVLLGHLHTHEWAAGGSTDQVGNPWAVDRTAGGSSGGSAAALAAHMVPAATGSDTAGSLRIPSALCGTSTVKPTHGALPLDGVLPLSRSLDHPGPMARSVADCALLLGALSGERPVPAPESLVGVRIALTPRLDRIPVDADVEAGLRDAVVAARALGAEVVEPPAPEVELDIAPQLFGLIATEMLADHREFDEHRGDYRASIQELLAFAEQTAMTEDDLRAVPAARAALAATWSAWLAEHRVDALLEPTVGFVAPPRGTGYDHFVIPDPYTLWTHHWDWTGQPVVSLPAGLGADSGLPVGVSLVGDAGSERRLLALGATLQGALGLLPDPLA